MTHPSKDITGTSGTQLSGKKIALLVSSSVASFKVPEIARELMRHGADVYAVISPSTEKMIGSDLLEWATGNPVVRELTGKLEHITLAGKSSGHVDLVLIAPATANTIGKLASGIDKLDAYLLETRNVLLSYWMIIQWLVHRWCNENRQFGTDGGRSHCCDRRIVNSRCELPDRVSGCRCDEN